MTVYSESPENGYAGSAGPKPINLDTLASQPRTANIAVIAGEF
jgi:hypothetical protein